MTQNRRALGIIRRIDDLGRVTVPAELRKAQHWEERQQVEMFTDQDGALVIKPYKGDIKTEELIKKVDERIDQTDIVNEPHEYFFLKEIKEALEERR